MKKSRLLEILENFTKIKVVVAGDFFLDVYNFIDSSLEESSLETKQKVYAITKREVFPGGAGNVAKNLASLGAKVFCLGIIADDGNAYELLNSLDSFQIDSSKFIYSSRLTPSYIKNFNKNKEISRFDLKNNSEINFGLKKKFFNELIQIISQVNACALIDQVSEKNFGVFPEDTLDKINDLAKTNPDKLFFADSRTKINSFKNMILKPNEFEATQNKKPSLEESIQNAKNLSKNNNSVFLTLGKKGSYFYNSSQSFYLDSIKVKPQDIVGAGDSFLAGLILSLSSNATNYESAQIASIISAITITKPKTGQATQQEVIDFYDKYLFNKFCS